MKNIQELFNEREALKQERKILKSSINDAFQHSDDYQEAIKKYNSAKIEKRAVVDQIKNDFKPETDRVEEINLKVKELDVMIADVALTRIMKGERVEVYGKFEQEYEPSLSVKFHKKR